MKVVVVGGGIAGTAAAWTARTRGARVTLVTGGSGATELATGALDDGPAAAHASPLELGTAALVRALEVFVVPAERWALVATTAGVVRPARGHDAALLDWWRLGRKRVGVVRARRPGWDADWLARSWSGRQGVEAVPVEATVLRHADERVVPDADFAARHDDDDRFAWLSDRLREALARAGGLGALVLPPCLGVTRCRAEALSLRLGIPCGEASALPGGASGSRFRYARSRALAAAGVDEIAGRAASVERKGEGWSVQLEGEGSLEADAVVLAPGGLVGGGVAYAPSEWAPAAELPGAARIPFRFAIACDAVRLGAHGRALEPPGSLFGPSPESLAWPFTTDAMMDRVGAMADGEGRVAEGLFVAGEAAADVPHAWLSALASGVRAGEGAARRIEAFGRVGASAG